MNAGLALQGVGLVVGRGRHPSFPLLRGGLAAVGVGVRLRSSFRQDGGRRKVVCACGGLTRCWFTHARRLTWNPLEAASKRERSERPWRGSEAGRAPFAWLRVGQLDRLDRLDRL